MAKDPTSEPTRPVMPQHRTRALSDLVFAIAILALVLTLASVFDAAERWEEWADAREDWEVDELPIMLAVGALVFAWFSFRRWRDYRREALLRHDMNEQLQVEIAERAQALERLEENQDRYRALYNKTPVMLHSIDWQGRLVSVSDFWLSRFGYERSEVIGHSIVDFLTEESRRQAEQTALADFFDTGPGREVDYRFVNRDGQVMDVLMSAMAERDATGELIRSLAVLIDVTERKAVEQQLLQAQKMEVVGQLTGGMAHDFNNLLSVIIGNLELLERNIRSDPAAQRRTAAALQAAERGAELNRRLLAFSRRQVLETQVVDVNQLLGGMSGLLRRTLGEAVELAFSGGADLWPVKTDASQLEAAVLNLALNGRDAMRDGGRLTIETVNTTLDPDYAARELEVEPGDYVQITVTDSGTGMTPEILAKVFEPFFTSKETGKGTGLGLSMVQGFVKQSGGHVKIYSEVGRGTSVKLYLPRVSVVESVDAAASDEEPEVAGAGGTILVVDDREDVRQVVLQMLEDLGYGVLMAENGPTALEVLERTPTVDLLLTDIVMPGGMTGPELAQAATARQPGLKVLYMSGYAESAVLRTGEVAAGRDLVSKPFRKHDLARRIRDAIAQEAPG